jgi:hypothetical protein
MPHLREVASADALAHHHQQLAAKPRTPRQRSVGKGQQPECPAQFEDPLNRCRSGCEREAEAVLACFGVVTKQQSQPGGINELKPAEIHGQLPKPGFTKFREAGVELWHSRQIKLADRRHPHRFALGCHLTLEALGRGGIRRSRRIGHASGAVVGSTHESEASEDPCTGHGNRRAFRSRDLSKPTTVHDSKAQRLREQLRCRSTPVLRREQQRVGASVLVSMT